jgi:pSer/pThr/pTyr-binding forkhead associated (FHA) protein
MPRVSIHPPGELPVSYRFGDDREVVWIGRDAHNDIVIDRASVSTRHAALRRVEDGYELIDAGSTNGLMIDGLRQSVVSLEPGMSVMIGDVRLTMSASDEEIGSKERSAARFDAGAARRPGRVRPQPVHSGEGRAMGLGPLVWLLTGAAFVAGMAVRFQSDTGRSFIEAVRSRFE